MYRLIPTQSGRSFCPTAICRLVPAVCPLSLVPLCKNKDLQEYVDPNIVHKAPANCFSLVTNKSRHDFVTVQIQNFRRLNIRYHFLTIFHTASRSLKCQWWVTS